jgi:hypothetical protein
VTHDFGQAEVHAPDGSSAIVQVRQAGDDDLTAGTVALLFAHDADGEFFWVVPLDVALHKEKLHQDELHQEKLRKEQPDNQQKDR